MLMGGLRRDATLEHKLGDEHELYIYGGIGVQRGHLRVGHELCVEHGYYVSGGIGMAGVVRTFGWDVIY